MWKHIPAKESHQLKAGDRIQVRWGKVPSYEFRIDLLKDNSLRIGLYDQDGDRKCEVTRRSENTIQLRHDFNWHIPGSAFDLWVEEEKAPEPKEPVRKCLVHKSRVVLNKGQRFVTEPYTSSLSMVSYELVVCDAVSNRPGYWNVLVKPSDGGNFHVHLSALDDKAAHFLGKQCVYLMKGENVQTCPNGAKAIPERDEDEGSKYIIWCPTSNLPPRVILEGAAKAKAVAVSMSERHGSEFYWCRLCGKVSQKIKVVKTTSTEIIKL